MKTEKRSPAIQLISLIYSQARNDSWLHFNHSLYEALQLAIRAGLLFYVGDFALLDKHRAENGFDFWRWGGISASSGHKLGESLYAQACEASNLSACQSFEAWAQRKPFFFKQNDGQSRRIAIGMKFA